MEHANSPSACIMVRPRGRKSELDAYSEPYRQKEISNRAFSDLERFPSDMNRDSQRGGKGGVLASDSAWEANHGQTLFTGLTGTCDWSG
jgi:hypothetical protein